MHKIIIKFTLRKRNQYRREREDKERGEEELLGFSIRNPFSRVFFSFSVLAPRTFLLSDFRLIPFSLKQKKEDGKRKKKREFIRGVHKEHTTETRCITQFRQGTKLEDKTNDEKKLHLNNFL